MDRITWLTRWLRQHPLKGPSEAERTHFTAEVMARIRALTPPEPAPAPVRRWVPWPGRAVLALATAAAGIAVVMAIAPRTARQLARERASPVVLAESPTDEEAWVSETIALLDQLEEGVPDDAIGDETLDSNWLEELEWLDKEEMATSS